MAHSANIPIEGDLHSVVTIDTHRFELRYGYRDDRDRATGEPYILYPDLVETPLFTSSGQRIVTALQDACPHYQAPPGREPEDCCYTCSFYPDPSDELGICQCEKNRVPHNPKEVT